MINAPRSLSICLCIAKGDEKNMEERKANILRIERISLSDGEGMRTVVFFKGCPLRCAWCSTPESQKAEPEMYYKKERCKFCGRCIEVCPEHALSFDINNIRIVRDYERCIACGKCKDSCLHRAQMVYGKTMTVKQVMKEILKDELFYWHSGGGVTFSGGSVLLYPDFVREVIEECREAAISTAAELEMQAPFSSVEKVVSGLDFFYTDIKTMDPGVHRQWTGADNARILENIRRASTICAPGAIHARTPLIHGINDDKESIRRIAEFCSTMDNISELEFLPYHRLGIHAYAELGREYRLSTMPGMSEEEAIKRIKHLFVQGWPFDIKVAGHVLYRSLSEGENIRKSNKCREGLSITKGCF